MDHQSGQPQSQQAPDQVSDFVYLNFLTYLQPEHDPAALATLARDTVAWNRSQHEDFQDVLASLSLHFRGDPAWPDHDRMALPPPALSGWETVEPVIREISDRHQGMLIALFHYGAHRSIISDLALNGLPVVAPVSPESCQDYGAVIAEGPAEYQRNLELLSVADPRVGRRLLAALRRGKTGVIYVDGNMGPPTGAPRQTREQDSAIEFLGRRIGVKSGIARLSTSMQKPILPLFAGRPRDDAPARVIAGTVITPAQKNDGKGESRVMQRLYSTLGEHIMADPALWEFGAYAHRWLLPHGQQKKPPLTDPVALDSDTRLTINQHRVAPVHRSDGLFWVDVGDNQRGLRLPDEHVPALERLATGGSWTVGELRSLAGADCRIPFDDLLAHLVARSLLRAERTGSDG